MSKKQPRCRVCHEWTFGVESDPNHVQCLTDTQLDTYLAYWRRSVSLSRAKGDRPKPPPGAPVSTLEAAQQEKAARYRWNAWKCSTRWSTGYREWLSRQREGIKPATGVTHQHLD
jgi:hypothetical protein